MTHDPTCGAMQWFHPLATIDEAEMGVADQHSFSGSGLGTKWSDPQQALRVLRHVLVLAPSWSSASAGALDGAWRPALAGLRHSLVSGFSRTVIRAGPRTRPFFLAPPMEDIAAVFLEQSRTLLTSDFLPKIERCLERLEDEDVWWRPNDASNSVGNLVLHLCGNVSQWILAGVGGREYLRHRQQEFDERGPVARAELRAKIRGVVVAADEVLGSLDEAALLSRRQIQGYDTNVLDAVYHVVEHFSMHTGQIITLTKMRTAQDLKLWEPPRAQP